MDIEDLSKAQLLLLTVMVNFVVSIATGVLTVSLLDQAPLPVSQGVDRIVEHTIQTIATPIQVVNPIKSITAPANTPNAGLSAEQLLTSAVGTVSARSVLIYKGSTTTPALAFGTYLPKSRVVATAFVPDLPKEALITFSDGSTQSASLSKTSDTLAIYGFADSAELPKAPDANITSLSSLKQGQTVITLTKDSAAISGIISKAGTSTIETSLKGVPVGGGVVNLSGHVLGLGGLSVGTLIPAESITALLEAAAAKK